MIITSSIPKNFTLVIKRAPSWIIFFLFDFLDVFLCIVFRFFDEVFEEKAEPCHCDNPQETTDLNEHDFLSNGLHLSETLYRRRNVFRRTGFLRFARKLIKITKKIGIVTSVRRFVFLQRTKKVFPRYNRWSDCGCKSCVSWTNNYKLNFIIKQLSISQDLLINKKPVENVIFVHGFSASSSFWTKTLFKYLTETTAKIIYRFFAIDLLGFGDSPKPRDSCYSLQEHVEMIEKSVIIPFNLTSFHIVAHSMGCIIAIALAAKYSNTVKSVTLVAPPYFSDSKGGASCDAFEVIAEKKLWPPISFFTATMCWYEHICRAFCLIVCRNHRTWERIIKLVTWRRTLPTVIMDVLKHTHKSAWHSMHNVICGGAKFTDKHLETLIDSGVKINVVHRDRDTVVPIDCLWNMKAKFPEIEVEVIAGANHSSVIMSTSEVFVSNLLSLWTSTLNL